MLSNVFLLLWYNVMLFVLVSTSFTSPGTFSCKVNVKHANVRANVGRFEHNS